ncbi:MAG TPA: hypothetical protein VN782_08360 [Usitatibacter sp.]|nr:hypothetical protein [Usitatibacter sp.]
MMPALELATGSLHAEMLGVHYIVNFTWIRDGADPPPCPCRPVDRFEDGDWSLELEAPQAAHGAALAWLARHGGEMRDQFDQMVRYLRRAFPDGGARRLRILVLPAGSRFDGSWTTFAVGDQGLPMTFARPLPGPSQAEDTSVARVMPVLAHEYAHSYFWFHRARYRNNFSDEVGAYTVERCLDAALFGAPYDELNGELQPFWGAVADLSPGALYAKYHARYPDTYLAVFAAIHELREAERAAHGERKAGVRAYCESAPLSGRDFTTP